MLRFFLLGVLWLATGALHGQTRGSVKVQWLGHAAFEITSPAGTVLLLDPYLTQNPNTPDSLKRLGRYHPAAIVVSHSHADHLGDALALATANRVKIISPRMTAVYSRETLADSLQLIFNVGGTVQVGDVRISAVPAMHSSDFGGRPIGIILSFTNGETIYHTGDTWVFGDMALIQEFYHPTILLLGVGGGAFGQDAATARAAVRKYFRPRVILPMHYGPVPFRLATEADIRAVFAGDKRVRVLQPGQSARFGR
jgi:L-ascorbate metabolism protein UlaG (beta-lactamase superfamily)